MRIIKDKIMLLTNLMFLININMFWNVLSKDVLVFVIVFMAALYVNIVTFNIHNIQGFMIDCGSTFGNKENVKASIISSIKIVRIAFIVLVILFFLISFF